MDHDLIARADRLLRAGYVPGRHAVAAALRAQDGRVFTGLHLGGTVARVSLCAETVALAQAIMVQQPRLERIVALHHASNPGSDATSALVTPCGMCRELLSDYAPHLHVIGHGGRGDPTSIAISELFPCKFVRLRESP